MHKKLLALFTRTPRVPAESVCAQEKERARRVRDELAARLRVLEMERDLAAPPKDDDPCRT